MPKASTRPSTGPRGKGKSATPYSRPKMGAKDKAIAPRGHGDPKQSHLYTDDNPSTTLHGTGFKDAETAHHTIKLVSQRSLTYQWQVINTMHYRAKGHPAMKADKNADGMKAAMAIFETWLKETYPQAKEQRQKEGREFKPLLKKETVGKYLTRIQALKPQEQVDTVLSALDDCKRFAEMYASLAKGKRLANLLLDDKHPEEEDWEIRREKALIALNAQRQKADERDLWNAQGGASDFHIQCIGWAWSPVFMHGLEDIAKVDITGVGCVSDLAGGIAELGFRAAEQENETLGPIINREEIQDELIDLLKPPQLFVVQ